MSLALCNFYWALKQEMPLASLEDEDTTGSSNQNNVTILAPMITAITTTSITVDNDNSNSSNSHNSNNSNSSSNYSNTNTQPFPNNEMQISYQKMLQETLQPFPNVSTTFHSKVFFAGLCNQYMRFMGLIFLASMEGYGQIIEESIQWKDTYGHNDLVPHSMLWDVVHWNTYYPTLPRLVSFQQEIHRDLTLSLESINLNPGTFVRRNVQYHPSVIGHLWDQSSNHHNVSIVPPPLMRKPMEGKNKYKQLVRQIDMDQAEKTNPVQLAMYKAMLEGALRPHPFLQGVIDQTRMELLGAGTGTETETGQKGYMVLHARVEPDMARENERICRQYRVMNMTEILDMIYDQYPEPPVTTVLIVLSRALMEEEAQKQGMKNHHHHHNEPDSFHIMNDHNLKTLNDILQYGMWNGKVKVVEAGSQMVQEAGSDFYRYYSNIAGSIVNFFLAIQSNILVGTEISTFSTLAMNSRIYRGQLENYFYRPQGLYWMSPSNDENVTKPHRFVC